MKTLTSSVFLFLCLWHAVSFAKTDKPNILFIFADDMTYDAISALGNEEIETPHLDRLVRAGTTFTHHLSYDGGATWATQNYSDDDWTAIEEWEFQANGALDLFVLNVRYQSAEGPDKDILYHVREYSESMEPDTITMIGLGDLDSTSGAGNDIRFDFASLAILNDGGVVVAYHDSSDPDPLFAVEIEMPVYVPGPSIVEG